LLNFKRRKKPINKGFSNLVVGYPRFAVFYHFGESIWLYGFYWSYENQYI